MFICKYVTCINKNYLIKNVWVTLEIKSTDAAELYAVVKKAVNFSAGNLPLNTDQYILQNIQGTELTTIYLKIRIRIIDKNINSTCNQELATA